MAQAKILTDEEFRKLQLSQVVLLKELDRVCRKNDICYVIAFGSMLGAIRHKGYIPWDDDADVMMLREDYERFRKCAHELNPDICFFQDHYNDPDFLWGYGKLRKTGTKYVRAGQEHMKGKTGIFIDIFPMDDVPRTLVGCMFQDIRCFLVRKTLYSRVGKYEAKGLVKLCYGFLSLFSVKSCYRAIEKMASKSSNAKPNRVRILMFMCDGKLNPKNGMLERYGMKKCWITERSEYEFEGIRLYGSKDYDACLKYLFDDYMTPPPESEREQHAPVSELVFGDEKDN